MVEVLVRAAPAVMDPHRVVRRDRSVNEGPTGAILAQLDEFLESIRLFPETEYVSLLSDEVNGIWHWLKHISSYD
jgi:hypothetical protein